MEKVIIIAEAGVNHNGSFAMAKQLVDKAAEAKVDYIKFQTYKSEEVVTKKAEQAEYQKRASGKDETQFDLIKKLELSYDQFVILKSYCEEKGVKFLSTSTGAESVAFLHSLDLDMWKIPSSEVNNYPFLKRIASFNKKTIFSCGMSSLEDVRKAINVLFANGLARENLYLLHCNTEYPTPYQDVNLKAMVTMGREFGVKIGYSDHTLGVEIPIAAVAMGATMIEKHFTLNRNLEGPDHKASLEPDELCNMVKSIRNVEQALGDGIKRVSESESHNVLIARKSIVAAKPIKKGDMYTEDNITTKRPAGGINPMRWNEVLGQIAPKDFDIEDMIEL